MLSRFVVTGILLVCILSVTGCSDEKVPDPPAAKAELTARLYDALKLRRDEEALAITDKLMALDQNDADLMDMRDRIIGNICTRNVQNMINSGKLNAAEAYLHNQRKKHPMLSQLQILENELAALQELTAAAANLAKADSIAELTLALDKIAPLAARYPQAKNLHKDIRSRRKELSEMRAAAAAQSDSVQPQNNAEKSTASGGNPEK